MVRLLLELGSTGLVGEALRTLCRPGEKPRNVGGCAVDEVLLKIVKPGATLKTKMWV
jgi:hypothetical protein